MQKKANLILLTGYLGSGKTTLIKYILKQQKTFKIAVIQNEFSDEMGIESPLMQDSEGKVFDKMYELPNGCICCTSKGDLIVAVEYLLKQENYQLDFILVETNGLSDPSNCIQTFWVDDEQEIQIKLQKIITIINPLTFQEKIKDIIFKKQILFSDTVIINFGDKAKEGQVIECQKFVESINPVCNFMMSNFAEIVNLAAIFSSEDRKNQLEPKQVQDEHSHPDEKIKSFYIPLQKKFNINKLEENLGQLAWEGDHKVYRMKGLIISDQDTVYELQGVEDIFEVVKTNLRVESIEQISKFLFVVQDISQKELIQQIQS